MDTENTRAPRLLRLPDVERLTSLRRSAIYLRVARGDFPEPLRISDRCSVWKEAEILAWIESLPRGTRSSSAPANPQAA
jgi:prophage regulatory protein